MPAFTVEYWTFLASGEGSTVNKRGPLATDPTILNKGWRVAVTRTDVVASIFGAYDHAAQFAAPLDEGWHHVAWTYADGRSAVFIDGIAQLPTQCDGVIDGIDCVVPAGTMPGLTAQPVTLGASRGPDGATDGFLIAVYDELRLSLGARYAEGFQPARRFDVDSDTLALLHFDEGTSGVAADATGNGHDGIATGGFTWLPDDGFGGTFCP